MEGHFGPNGLSVSIRKDAFIIVLESMVSRVIEMDMSWNSYQGLGKRERGV